MGVRIREKPPGSGIWWVFINHKGQRRAKKIGKKETALKVAEKIRARLILGQFDLKAKNSAPLFSEYSQIWLDDYVKPLRRASTYNRYNWIFGNYVKEHLGHLPIDQIKRKDIRALLLKLNKKGLSRSSLALVRDVISGPLGYAVDDEIIDANPATGIMKRLQLERDKRIPVEPLNHDEVALFLSTCDSHFKEHHPFFLCALRTGMRLGELLALEWGDVDWNGNFIRVSKSFRRGRIDKPKNGKQRRVDMSKQLKQSFKALLTRRKREALEAGAGEPVEIIFHKDGHHISQNSVRNVFKRILKKAGLRSIRVHDMRHTFASLLLSNGESPVYVKEQLGHSSISITVDIYGHLIPSSNREAVNRLDTLQPTRNLSATGTNKKP